MTFKHINSEDRVRIDELINEGRNNSYIARRIGVNPSTIGREIKRNQLKDKPVPRLLPKRPILLATDCRKFRGQGIAQDKYEAVIKYETKLREARTHNRYYVAKEASKLARTRRTIANFKRTRLIYGSGSWLEQYIKLKLIKEQWSLGPNSW